MYYYMRIAKFNMSWFRWTPKIMLSDRVRIWWFNFRVEFYTQPFEK